MSTLYVTEQGARVEREYDHLVVELEDEVRIRLRLDQISELVLVGRVSVTTPALHALLQRGAGVALLDRSGRLLGRLVPPVCGRRAVRAAQYQRTQDEAFCLAVARAIAAGKLHNQRVLAMRLVRLESGAAEALPTHLLQILADAETRLATATDVAGVRGIEGRAARTYFTILRSALQPGLAFSERSRRPPRDPVNALLGLGYTLLAQGCFTACESIGLDPYAGFYHSDRTGRPSLALDLMEEFRSVIVDSVVLNLVNREMVTARHFEPGPNGGVYLTGEGMRTFLLRYSARLQTSVQAEGVDHPLTYQKLFEVQARRLRKVIEGASEIYTPFRTR